MYPWHNQKDSAKANSKISLFSQYQCTHTVSPCTWNMYCTCKTNMHIIPGSEGTQEHHKSNHLVKRC